MLAAVGAIGELCPTWIDVIVASVVGYLIGSIPIANLVAQRHAKVDLRDVGDRNPGFWNARETLGVSAAVPVFVGDVAKGATAALIGVAIADPGVWGIGYIATAAAMVGHAFPLFADWRGGRSVLTFVGGVLVIAPVTAAISIAILLAVFVVTRSFAWAARAGMLALPFVSLAVQGPHRTAALGALMTFIGIRFATAARAEHAGHTQP